ncbi:MAG TPA: UDP-N-acetylglucosamine--N-acetylmuramyl-(pentapeptide) pyrophosphoryl-undecaprenol N-acetylglucosamine transferase [Phycisphaerales bacterium]|nr:UDP-N-acetylglucosamine--N-acetylmuramyl-(pentapeptide) pyrophosphoryl-undecaprenol N-acetylglucosamine transferase [Phycisphaerales bacterium]HMP37569.1 UDP-N-acetylglucosamine--N-acetylmuramyl-(pentapeptide) pyrophosphoryl-undecaprenol N-acetylglucosamine transferase [Phycisphaerales bacterium]
MSSAVESGSTESFRVDRTAAKASGAAAPVIAFAGGGSGGHISPGLAIAERLRELLPDSRSIFLCSERAIDETMLRDAGADHVALPALPFSLHPLRAARFIAAFRRARRDAEAILDRACVAQVVALGGFVAAPVVAAAARRRIPVTLVNLDARPGRANRWMARRSDRVLSAVPTPEDPGFLRRISRSGGAIVGMPLRRLAVAPGDPAECRARLSLDPATPTLLVTGASQGSASLNALMVEIARRRPDLLSGWQVLHLAGSGEIEDLISSYRSASIGAVVLPFLHRMGLAWGAADLSISRAGANSVAEAAANAVPTIFLPYPHHRDQHQRLNAQPMVDRGGAVVETDRLDPAANLAALQPVLESLLRTSARRERMREALAAQPPSDAAAIIARLLVA